MGAAFWVCLAAASGASADEPSSDSAATDAAAEPAADPPPQPASAETSAPKQPRAPKSAAAIAPAIKTNREAIALLYGFAFGLALIAIRLVARFRRDMFGRAAG